MNTKPGWYPDPTGAPGQRYHDGQRWTDHVTPTPPPAPTAVAVAVSHGGTSHGLHLVLTLLTCGLWLPIWVLLAIFGGASSSAVAVAGNGAVVQTANRKPLIALAMFGGFFLIGLMAQHPWLLIVLAVLGVLAGVGFWALKAAQGREVQQRREQFERDMLAQRADREDRLYQQGDPRGVHGQYLPPEFPR